MYCILYNGSVYSKGLKLSSALNLSVFLHQNFNFDHTICVVSEDNDTDVISTLTYIHPK